MLVTVSGNTEPRQFNTTAQFTFYCGFINDKVPVSDVTDQLDIVKPSLTKYESIGSDIDVSIKMLQKL